MDRLILNCDLGEDEPLELTEQLLSLVDAANIGCGFHAGSAEKTRATIRLAVQHQVMIGAHPGLPTAGGRGLARPNSQQFEALLETQIGQFLAAAHALGTTVDYVKLHGSLYHAVEEDSVLAQVFIQFLKNRSPVLPVFALAGGAFAISAIAAGLRVYHEAFADRGYRADGTLVPRAEPGAVLAKEEAVARLSTWNESGKWSSSGGHPITLKADTLCLHGDSPDALAMMRQIRQLIDCNRR